MNRRNWFAKLAAMTAAIGLTPKVKAEPKTYDELEMKEFGYVRPSLEERVAILQETVRNGTMSINEVRAEFGFGPLEAK